MTKESAEAQSTQKCKLLADSVPTGCAVITAQSKQNVPLQKRKEEAKKTLYLNRI
ncbi:MAG: hypothetical protein ABSF44_06315 [Candidatus Bathyarchaeia archaeon]|jgi:hypothetical protein